MEGVTFSRILYGMMLATLACKQTCSGIQFNYFKHVLVRRRIKKGD